jgi:hypothetical protein
MHECMCEFACMPVPIKNRAFLPLISYKQLKTTIIKMIIANSDALSLTSFQKCHPAGRVCIPTGSGVCQGGAHC